MEGTDANVDQPDAIAAALASDDDDQPQVVTPEPAEPEGEEPKEETPEAPAEETDGEDEKADGTETPAEGEQPEGDGEDLQPELDPKEEARMRFEARQAAKAERELRVKEQTQDYVNDSEATDAERRLRAIEVNDYNRQVESTENTLITEFERAKASPDLQIFNPDNKEEFNQRAYDYAMRQFNAGSVVWDDLGNMTGVKGSLYEHLTEMADLLSDSAKSGAVQQVRATRKMRANADTKPAAQPKETAKDPVLDILKSDD